MTMHICVIYVSLCLITYCISATTCLYPDQALIVTSLLSNSNDEEGSEQYALCQLKPSSSYEVRLSFLGSTGVDFFIEFQTPEEESHRLERSLLDVEKLMFTTDEAGYPQGLIKTLSSEESPLPPPIITIKLIPFDPNLNGKQIQFDIILETLTYGIPKDVPLMLLIAISCLFMFFRYVNISFLFLFSSCLGQYIIHIYALSFSVCVCVCVCLCCVKVAASTGF